MKWVSAISAQTSFDSAFEEVCGEVSRRLDGASPHLLLGFVSPHHLGGARDLSGRLRRIFPGALFLGCSGGGVIGGGREVEHAPAFSLTAAVLPDVELTPFRFSPEDLPATPEAWHAAIPVAPEQEPAFLLFPDPFSLDAAQVLRRMDQAWPRCTKLGGLASGGRAPGENLLFSPQGAHMAGLVGVALTGDVVVETIVAQGCRPIGPVLKITRCQNHLLYELDGKPAIPTLEQLYAELNPADKELFRRAPHVGVLLDDRAPRAGDFLVRNLLGLDRQVGALGVGTMLEVGQRVQFHVRDAATATEDLNELLLRYKREHRGSSPIGGLLFSCLGRGQYFFGVPDHDTEVLRRHLGAVPLGGFFCNGEIGPVHGRSFMHGYTSAFGLIRPRGWS